MGTQALLDAAIERSISKFLYVSSPSVAHAGTALIGEGNGAASPEHARGNYARSKATAELAVLAANGTKLASGSTMRVGRYARTSFGDRVILSWWSVS